MSIGWELHNLFINQYSTTYWLKVPLASHANQAPFSVSLLESVVMLPPAKITFYLTTAHFLLSSDPRVGAWCSLLLLWLIAERSRMDALCLEKSLYVITAIQISILVSSELLIGLPLFCKVLQASSGAFSRRQIWSFLQNNQKRATVDVWAM